MTAEGRAARTAEADEQCAKAYAAAGGPEVGVALVAVGGYGRGELAPFSDWDLVLVHDDAVPPGPVAEQVWYPLWDAAPKLDHSVRSFPEMVATADADRRPPGRPRAPRHPAPGRRPRAGAAAAYDDAGALAQARPVPVARAEDDERGATPASR